MYVYIYIFKWPQARIYDLFVRLKVYIGKWQRSHPVNETLNEAKVESEKVFWTSLEGHNSSQGFLNCISLTRCAWGADEVQIIKMKGSVHRRLSVTLVASYLQSAPLAEKQAWFAGVESPGGRAANTSLTLPPLTHYLTDSSPCTWGAARLICLNLRVPGCLCCSGKPI